MISPRDRLAQLAEGALPALVYPILTQNPITGETEKSFDALAHAADLKALLSERRVRREALIEAIKSNVKADATGLAPAVIGYHLFGFEEAADAILSLLNGDTND